jgi:hypothetical protein
METEQMIKTFEADSLVLKVVVFLESSQQNKERKNLTNATVSAFAQRSKSTEVIVAESTIIDPENGVVRVSFVPDTFGKHNYTIQVVVTDSEQVQTVLSTNIEVNRSLRPPV